MKTLTFIIAIIFFWISGAQAAPPLQGSVRPPWISVLPASPGRVYALGLAPVAPSVAKALAGASQNARGEVLGRLRASVKAETSITATTTLTREAGGRASGSSTQHVGQATLIQASATELPGLVVEETWVDGPGATAYALAYLDVPVAERELRVRFEAQRNDLLQEGATPEAPRERMRMLGRLKGAQVELAKLDDLAALIAAGGGDGALRGEVRSAKLALDRQLDQLRATLTLSLEGAQGATQIAGVVRNAALKAGLGWAEAGGAFRLVLDYRGDTQAARIEVQQQQWNGWWRGGWVSHAVDKDSGIVVARGLLTITLKDREGTAYESVDVEAKGLGVTDFQAENKLKDDFRAKVEKTFAKWLEGLVK